MTAQRGKGTCLEGSLSATHITTSQSSTSTCLSVLRQLWGVGGCPPDSLVPGFSGLYVYLPSSCSEEVVIQGTF